ALLEITIFTVHRILRIGRAGGSPLAAEELISSSFASGSGRALPGIPGHKLTVTAHFTGAEPVDQPTSRGSIPRARGASHRQSAVKRRGRCRLPLTVRSLCLYW